MSPHATHTKHGPNIFVHNENNAYAMSCVTAHAVTSYVHHAAHA